MWRDRRAHVICLRGSPQPPCQRGTPVAPPVLARHTNKAAAGLKIKYYLKNVKIKKKNLAGRRCHWQAGRRSPWIMSPFVPLDQTIKSARNFRVLVFNNEIFSGTGRYGLVFI